MSKFVIGQEVYLPNGTIGKVIVVPNEATPMYAVITPHMDTFSEDDLQSVQELTPKQREDLAKHEAEIAATRLRIAQGLE